MRATDGDADRLGGEAVPRDGPARRARSGRRAPRVLPGNRAAHQHLPGSRVDGARGEAPGTLDRLARLTRSVAHEKLAARVWEAIQTQPSTPVRSSRGWRVAAGGYLVTRRAQRAE